MKWRQDKRHDREGYNTYISQSYPIKYPSSFFVNLQLFFSSLTRVTVYVFFFFFFFPACFHFKCNSGCGCFAEVYARLRRSQGGNTKKTADSFTIWFILFQKIAAWNSFTDLFWLFVFQVFTSLCWVPSCAMPLIRVATGGSSCVWCF